VKRSRLNPISPRRHRETAGYRAHLVQFLFLHPYCQVWLKEHGIAESHAIWRGGVVKLANGHRLSVPLSTQVHHMNKRRGADLLDQRHWLAVCAEYHRRIETDKAWARDRGYLMDF
jgi:hypothetical protein